jgi:predicted nucleotidyltransferase
MINRKLLFKCQSGSHLYGLNTPESDIDYVSVFLPSAYDVLSLQKCEYINNSTKSSTEDRRNTKDDIDDVAYSLPRYLTLALGANPNLIEILFASQEVVEIEDPIFTYIKENYSKFLSARVFDSFMGFAVSQRKKLEYKKTRFTQLESAINYLEQNDYRDNDLSRNDSAMSEETATYLNSILFHYKGLKNNTESFHKGLPLKTIYEKLISELNRYGWRLHTDSFSKLGYDTKFASHTIRLLHEGRQLLETGKLQFPITGKAFDDIMSIKTAQVSIEDFYKICTEYEDACRKASKKSTLPISPDWKWINDFLVEVMTAYIRRERYEPRYRDIINNGEPVKFERIDMEYPTIFFMDRKE